MGVKTWQWLTEERRMTSKSNEGRKTFSEVKQQQQQQPASEKLPGGSPKQVPSLGVLLSLQKYPKNIKRSLNKGKSN